MNWNEEAYEYAEARSWEYFGHLPEQMFEHGAKWQRDQLRTNEAVARLANFLHNDDVGETLNEHEESCRIPDCEERNLYAEYAHAAITALLGDN